jgi:hypothetical protein
MFETLESRELMSTTLPTADVGTTTTDTPTAGIDAGATADAKGTKSGSTGGKVYLVFTFKLVAVKTISWSY